MRDVTRRTAIVLWIGCLIAAATVESGIMLGWYFDHLAQLEHERKQLEAFFGDDRLDRPPREFPDVPSDSAGSIY